MSKESQLSNVGMLAFMGFVLFISAKAALAVPSHPCTNIDMILNGDKAEDPRRVDLFHVHAYANGQFPQVNSHPRCARAVSHVTFDTSKPVLF
jgi:hypothetical protein